MFIHILAPLFLLLSPSASASALILRAHDPDPLTATAVVVDPTCFGTTGGSIAITATGGTPPYHGDVNASGQATFDNLSAGSYSYEIFDAEDVLFTLTVELGQPDSLAVAVTSLTHQTPDSLGTVKIVPAGGTAPYVYSWENGADLDTLSNLIPGTYAYTVTDANGCSVVDAVLIRDLIPPPSATYELLSAVTCAGDSNAMLRLTVEGGVPPYHGDSNAAGDTVLSNLPGGTYTYRIYDARDSVVVLPIIVDKPDTLSIDVLSMRPERSWEKGRLKIAVSGGVRPYTYDWGSISLAGDLITELTNGTYRLLLTDANGCTHQDSFVIEDLTSTRLLDEQHVSIYPTLVTDFLHVDLQREARIRRLTVLNASGQIISRREYGDLSSLTLEAGQLPRLPGTYILLIETPGGRVRAKRFVSAGR